MDKFLRVNMKKLSATCEKSQEKYAYMGGRMLTGQLLLDEVTPTCEPLGRHNKLIIAPGLLGGTQAPMSSRLSVGAKSPLTGGIKEANVGGPVGQKLSRLGYKAIIIEEKPENEQDWYIVKIDHEGAELLKDNSLVGLDNYDACALLQEKHGKNIGIFIIGVAGERQYPLATCACADADGIPARHAGRGGMGAVMGSKKVKAVLIDDSKAPAMEYSDKDEFFALSKNWAKDCIESKKLLTKLGTSNLVMTTNLMGCLATRNFSQGSFEGAAEISGERMYETIVARGGNPSHGCYKGCVVRCSNVYNGPDGKHMTSSLEFETLVLMGSNLAINDLDAVARIDRFCDGFGADTMELGVAFGTAMEGGILPFGDVAGVMDLIEQIKQNTILGRVLTQGATITGRVLGVSRIAAVKGQSMAAYDPRGLKGTAVTYATAPMGADHTYGNCMPGRPGYRPETQETPHPTKAEGQVEWAKDMQILTAFCDAMGLCYIAVSASLSTARMVAKLLSARYGREFTVEDVIQIGKDTILTEVEFNNRAGITKAHNYIPEHFVEEKLSPVAETFDIDKKELEDFYDNF